MSTVDDLKSAFAGESQANRKYLAWAKQADAEGHPGVAKLFRAVAAAETVHAHGHLRTLGDIKSTAENLEAAIAGENYEVVSMYPDFMKQAESEKHAKALRSFTWAWEVEQIHEVMYRKALEDLQAGQVAEVTYWVCNTCGHTHVGNEPPDKCPICGAKSSGYTRID